MNSNDIGTRYQRLFQYFWDPEPRNDDPTGQAIWCLGRSHPGKILSPPVDSKPVCSPEQHKGPDPDGFERVEKPVASTRTTEASNDEPWPPEFLDDFEARFWFTYRSEFPPIQRSTDAALTFAVRLRNIGESGGFTSDTGWGCMIRSGQCLLSNALSILWLGRDWRRGQSRLEERRLLALFADDPRAPFSIHKFVEHGAVACGKHPGEWFGPSATAQCIEYVIASRPHIVADICKGISSKLQPSRPQRIHRRGWSPSLRGQRIETHRGQRCNIQTCCDIGWYSTRNRSHHPCIPSSPSSRACHEAIRWHRWVSTQR